MADTGHMIIRAMQVGPDGWMGIHGALGGKRPEGNPELESAVPTPIPAELASAYSPPHYPWGGQKLPKGRGTGLSTQQAPIGTRNKAS